MVYSIRMKFSPKSIVYSIRIKIRRKSMVYSIRMKSAPNFLFEE